MSSFACSRKPSPKGTLPNSSKCLLFGPGISLLVGCVAPVWSCSAVQTNAVSYASTWKRQHERNRISLSQDTVHRQICSFAALDAASSLHADHYMLSGFRASFRASLPSTLSLSCLPLHAFSSLFAFLLSLHFISIFLAACLLTTNFHPASMTCQVTQDSHLTYCMLI